MTGKAAEPAVLLQAERKGRRVPAASAASAVQAKRVNALAAAHGRSGIAAKVVAWQRSHGRHGLPWQGTRDPYRVWLSEVMLQQTQVSVVLQYYPRFLKRFRDVQALAAAPQDDVMALWSGLGYYSRARNLHRCAQVVVDQHGGAFPPTSAALAQLPGIGRSTAAAIAAFCFGERVSILDGNVKRLFTRLLGDDGDIGQAGAQNALWARADALLPPTDDGDCMASYTQGLMDLGATICLARRPSCLLCPLADDCVALAEGQPERYPVKGRRPVRGTRDNALLWLQRGDDVYLVQRPPKGVWAALWSLPEYPSADALQAASIGWPGSGDWLPSLHHTLTHLDWTLHTLRWQLPDGSEPLTDPAAGVPAGVPAGRWVSLHQALQMGLPAPVRRLLNTSHTG